MFSMVWQCKLGWCDKFGLVDLAWLAEFVIVFMIEVAFIFEYKRQEPAPCRGLAPPMLRLRKDCDREKGNGK